MALHNDDGSKRKTPITHVVVTGGEPCLYGQSMSDLVLGLLITGFHITIETNGTKYIEIQSKQKNKEGAEVDLTGNLMFSISPKLASSTPVGTEHEKMHNKNRTNEVVLEALLKRYPSYLKFVVSSEADLEEINQIRGKLNLTVNRVFLMPEGVTREEITVNGPKTVELCIANGFRYSPREHITLWDKKRCV
jgi:7-carboxy-7-deazaguanine synthase